ncbi:hypothetical protein D9757_002401 [Collybiopsis confluens]|uniref:RecQ-mediated genome instability protein 1 n=1 Tax=Collybiopsis confluens TaxID=2823264 RepID=A0A8H5HY73_9AGAR|nr:hypothetical protein D9757_002401 [Collybiopsis confluens]
MPLEAVQSWLKIHYPKPSIDPEWLQACYDWVIEEKQLDPATDTQKIIGEVEAQLLGSDLHDSMMQGTGIPGHIANAEAKVSKLAGPILMQIETIDDIGRRGRAQRKKQLDEAVDEVESEEESIPSYSRSMLKFEISDGATTMQATEYRPMENLVLGDTRLGFKLLVQNAEVRRGVIFLEPKNTTLKGHSVSDLEAHQVAEFARRLRQRLGLPEPEDSENSRSPLRDISPPPSPTLANRIHPHSDDEDQPRRRRIPAISSPVSSSTLYNGAGVSGFARDARDAGDASAHDSGFLPVESDDEAGENRQVGTRAIKPMPARARTSTSSIGLPAHDKGKAKVPESDFDDMFNDLPSSFWEKADQIVIEEVTKSLPSPPAALPTDTSSTDALESLGASYHVANAEVITIEDDEEDDKENVPVPTRHVRRRTAGRPVIQGEVIDLSDSDS